MSRAQLIDERPGRGSQKQHNSTEQDTIETPQEEEQPQEPEFQKSTKVNL